MKAVITEIESFVHDIQQPEYRGLAVTSLMCGYFVALAEGVIALVVR